MERYTTGSDQIWLNHQIQCSRLSRKQGLVSRLWLVNFFFSDDVISSQDNVIASQISYGCKIFITHTNNFWNSTSQLPVCIYYWIWKPYYSISISKKLQELSENQPTCPCFRLNRLRWIRWWSQILWLPVV